MNKKVNDLTIDELKNLISQTVKESLEDYLEDIDAIKSKSFQNSIKEAGEDYKSGDYKNLDEILDV